ncbi:hypothetical protein PENFLA_c124G10592 [Penicillium flavigenum]|nr:hypothetical protein PENFLA_c124G10592 [Penicillium flavigenum]
MSREILK